MTPKQPWPFIGHETLGQHLLDTLRSDRLPPVLLFVGPRHVGKASAAQWLARVDLCTEQADAPCGICVACRQMSSDGHPSCLILGSDSGSVINVEDVRRATATFSLTLRPNEHRWLLIADAERLTDAASSAFLKSLEEPPPGTRVILTTSEPDRLPQTILSRSAIYRWHLVSSNDLRTALADVPQLHSADALSAALGRPGWLFESELEDTLPAAEILLNALGQNPQFQTSQTTETATDDMTRLLTTWQIVYRDILNIWAGNVQRLAFPHLRSRYEAVAAQCSLPQLLTLYERLLMSNQLLHQHVQPRLVINDLLLA